MVLQISTGQEQKCRFYIQLATSAGHSYGQIALSVTRYERNSVFLSSNPTPANYLYQLPKVLTD